MKLLQVTTDERFRLKLLHLGVEIKQRKFWLLGEGLKVPLWKNIWEKHLSGTLGKEGNSLLFVVFFASTAVKRVSWRLQLFWFRFNTCLVLHTSHFPQTCREIHTDGGRVGSKLIPSEEE